MEEREKVQKATEGEEPDVEAHKVLKGRDDAPTIEREKVIRADDDDDGPDVEAHKLLKN